MPPDQKSKQSWGANLSLYKKLLKQRQKTLPSLWSDSYQLTSGRHHELDDCLIPLRLNIGATTLSIRTFRKMALSIRTFGTMTLAMTIKTATISMTIQSAILFVALGWMPLYSVSSWWVSRRLSKNYWVLLRSLSCRNFTLIIYGRKMLGWKTCGLYSKSFMIVIYDHNDSKIVWLVI